MPQFTLPEYAALLTRTFTPRFPRDDRPRAVSDTNDKGEETLEFILPHPKDGRFSASLTVSERKGIAGTCALRFGQAEVASALDPEEAIAAIEEVVHKTALRVNDGDGVVFKSYIAPDALWKNAMHIYESDDRFVPPTGR